MLRLVLQILLLWALALPALAETQSNVIVSIETSGRELRVPIDEGYVLASKEDPETLEFLAGLIDKNKLELIDILLTAEDIERSDQRLNPRSMTYKIATDPMFGVEVVNDEVWDRDLPVYRASMARIDVEELDALVQEKFDDAINKDIPENVKFDTGDISQPLLYRSEPHGFRMWSSVQQSLTVDGKAEVAKFLTYAAIVNLRGRNFLLTAEVIAPEKPEEYDAKRDEFDRFVDRVVALNGGKTRG